MLTSLYVSLRFLHFAALMVTMGCLLYGTWLAVPALRRLLMRRFDTMLRCSLGVNAVSATLMLPLQGGMMGEGWQDVFHPDVWMYVLQTQFGSVWLWQIILAWIAVAIVGLRPHRWIRVLLILCIAQFVLLAGVGHAAMNQGIGGAIQRLNHAAHLLCAAAWAGGLLPFIYCLALAKGRWRNIAILTMMRFSRYGHLAVAGVVASGLVNVWCIQGAWLSSTPYGVLLSVKVAFVLLMVAIALLNRYVLVPRMQGEGRIVERLFLYTTRCEVVLAALVLAAVSLFATWEPY